MYPSEEGRDKSIPVPFSYLSKEEYSRLEELVDMELDFLSQGFVKTVFNTLRGQNTDRLDEITKLAQMPSKDDTMQAITGAVLINFSATSPEDIQHKLVESIMKGTGGTGKLGETQARVVSFAALVARKVWDKKPSRH